jgi:hypothetical protein
MPGFVIVLRGVPVFGLVAAANLPAAQTRSEMQPLVTQGYAAVADVAGRLDRFDEIEMRAVRHREQLGGIPRLKKGHDGSYAG